MKVQKYTGPEVAEIGRFQRWILLLVLASICVNALSFVFPIAKFLSIIVSIVGLILVYWLASTLKQRPAWLWALLAVIPLLNLIILLSLNSQATGVLRSKGVRVGLMGASGRDIDLLDASFD